MGFTSYDQLIQTISQNGNAEDLYLFKHGSGVSNPTAGYWVSYWAAVGQPGAGSNTDGATSSQNGGITFPAVSPLQRYLTCIGAIGASNTTGAFGMLLLYDRLVVKTAINLSSTGAKTINSATITRYTSGIGTEVWVEIVTGNTNSAPVWHLSKYTNQDGTPNQVGGSYTAVVANTSGILGPLPLAITDVGVKSVEEITVDTAASGPSSVNIVIMKPIALFYAGKAIWHYVDQVLQPGGPPPIYDGATLALAWLFSSNTSVNALAFHISTAWV